MGTYMIYVSTNRGPFEPYELGPLYNERQASVVVARLAHMAKVCGNDRRYEYRRES